MSEEAVPIMETAYDASRAEADLAYIVQQKKIIEWYEIQIAQANEKIEKAEARLKSFGISYRQTVGNSRVSLSNGSMVISKARERTEIYDREAWQKWVESHAWPDDFYFKRPIESKIKAALRDGINGELEYALRPKIDAAAFPADIPIPMVEIVPGIRRIIPGPHDYNVKINAGRNITEEQSDDDNE